MSRGRQMRGRNEKRGFVIGSIAGVGVFAIVGFLPSAFVGGMLGLKAATYLFGAPLGTAVPPRLVTGLFMLLGVSVAGTVFTVSGGTIGWLAGHALYLAGRNKSYHITIDRGCKRDMGVLAIQRREEAVVYIYTE